MKNVKENIYLLLSVIIFLVSALGMGIYEKAVQGNIYGLPAEEGTLFKPNRTRVTDIYGFEKFISMTDENGNERYYEVYDNSPDYLPQDLGFRFLSCSVFYGESGAGDSYFTRQFLMYEGQLYPVVPDGELQEIKKAEKLSEDQISSSYSSAAAADMNGDGYYELYYISEINWHGSYQTIRCFDTKDKSFRQCDYSYCHYVKSYWQQPALILAVKKHKVFGKSELELWGTGVPEDEITAEKYSPDHAFWYFGLLKEKAGQLNIDNEDMFVTMEPTYVYETDEDIELFLQKLADERKIDFEKSISMGYYRQIISNLKKYLPEMSAEKLYGFYEQMADYNREMDSYDMSLFYESPGDDADSVREYILKHME